MFASARKAAAMLFDRDFAGMVPTIAPGARHLVV